MKTNYIFSLLAALLISLNGFAEETGPCPETPQDTPVSTPPEPSSAPSDSHVTTPPADAGANSTSDQMGVTFNPNQNNQGKGDGATTFDMGGKGGGGDKKTFGPSDFMYFMRSYITTVTQKLNGKEKEILVKRWEKDSGLKDAEQGKEKAWKNVLKASETLNQNNWNVRHFEQWYNEYKQYEDNPKATDFQRANAGAARDALEYAKKDPGYQKAKVALDAAEEQYKQAGKGVDKAMNSFYKLQSGYQNQNDAGHADIPPVQ